MQGLRQLLSEEYQRMEAICEKTSENLKDTPDGNLRLSESRKKTQFYQVFPGENKFNGRYIPLDKMDLVMKLAQKEYDMKMLKLSEKRMKQIGRLLKDFDDNEVELVYSESHPARRKLIIPVEETRNQKLEKWYALPYQGKDFPAGTPVIMTEKGERVRSKSEKIIADHLYRNGIHYKYECPLLLKGFGMIYPDFTLFSGRIEQEVYLEHEGRMDDPEYADTAVKKIALYERNGIFPGQRLLLTFETMKNSLDMRLFDKMIESFEFM